MISNERVEAERKDNRLAEFKTFLSVVSHQMALPLYFVFWICDMIYVPDLKWQFLALRSVILPVVFFVPKALARTSSLPGVQILAMTFSFMTALPISIMACWSAGGASPYYAGLNLVAIGTLSFLPWSTGYFIGTVAAIYIPYYFLAVYSIHDLDSLRPVLVNSFFVIGTVTISVLIRYFSEKLRQKETASRLQLELEIENRNRIILEKTAEAVKLATLSSQFSPQVVEAIRSGEIDVASTIHRANICAIFIDIVNSTERVVRLDKDKVYKAISMFMEDTIKTLLKYDITVDKFLGDGILAFSNDPVRYDDYLERALQAAIEVREKIKSRRESYLSCWMNTLEIRVGIATGFANVGFYGHEKYYYRSYTAIGPVINLASRLCSIAEPNQIVLSEDVRDGIGDGNSRYSFKFLGNKSLKGFETDLIRAFEANPTGMESLTSQDELDCPSCKKGTLFLANDEAGIYVLRCRSCGYVHDPISAANGTRIVA